MKTRLGLGASAECAAYQRLVETVLNQVSNCQSVELRFAPRDAEGEIRKWLQAGWVAAPQADGDLGTRMQTAFADAFAGRASRVVIIGSDCPYLTGDDIREAWKALDSADLVLGPAKDGGYWLIGLRRDQPALFTKMAWSSEQVLTETIERAKALGLKTFLLRTLSDVDTRADWEKFISAEAQGRKPRRGQGEG